MSWDRGEEEGRRDASQVMGGAGTVMKGRGRRERWDQGREVRLLQLQIMHREAARDSLDIPVVRQSVQQSAQQSGHAAIGSRSFQVEFQILQEGYNRDDQSAVLNERSHADHCFRVAYSLHLPPILDRLVTSSLQLWTASQPRRFQRQHKVTHFRVELEPNMDFEQVDKHSNGEQPVVLPQLLHDRGWRSIPILIRRIERLEGSWGCHGLLLEG